MRRFLKSSGLCMGDGGILAGALASQLKASATTDLHRHKEFPFPHDITFENRGFC